MHNRADAVCVLRPLHHQPRTTPFCLHEGINALVSALHARPPLALQSIRYPRCAFLCAKRYVNAHDAPLLIGIAHRPRLIEHLSAHPCRRLARNGESSRSKRFFFGAALPQPIPYCLGMSSAPVSCIFCCLSNRAHADDGSDRCRHARPCSPQSSSRAVLAPAFASSGPCFYLHPCTSLSARANPPHRLPPPTARYARATATSRQTPRCAPASQTT